MKKIVSLLEIVFLVFIFTGCVFSSGGGSSSVANGKCVITNASCSTETIKYDSTVPQTVVQKVYFTWDYTGTLESFSFVARIAGTDRGYKKDSTKLTIISASNVSPGTTFEITITPTNGNPYSFTYTTPDAAAPAENTLSPVHAADSKTDIYDITGHSSVTLTNNNIKEIFLVRTNPTNVNSTSTRYIKNVFVETSASLQQSKNIAEIKDENIVFFEDIAEPDLATVESPATEDLELNIIHYIDQPVEKKPLVRATNARSIANDEILQAAVSAADYDFSWLKIRGELGENREFYAQTSQTGRSKISATLRYIDDVNKCYVWVADDCYTTGAVTNPGKRLNDEKIETLAKAFTENADYVRKIFGNEIDLLFCPNGNGENCDSVELTKASAFGDYVNFLIYDLYGDFTGSKPKSGTLGFFTNVDYYETEESLYKRAGDNYANNDWRKRTNGGKFLHIDAPWTVSYFDSMKSTVVHEFQHLIQYGQKEIYKDTKKHETWFAEMSSMLCEDLLQERLGLADEDTPKNRTKKFNEGYAKKSMMSYDGSSFDTAMYSYATSYIFGTYLARKYGGADFVYDVMHNDKHGTEALLTEIQKRGGDWESVLRDFGADLTTGAVLNNSTPITTTTHKMSDYNYPMKGFNIYNKDYKASGLDYYGPIVYDAIKSTSTTIYNYGLNLSTYAPSVTYNKLTISFDGSSGTGVKEYLVVVRR